MEAMIVGRVFADAGGIGMYLGETGISELDLSHVALDLSGEANRILSDLVWGFGNVLGPVVGGAFEKVQWRWAFYIILIIGGLFAPIYLFLLPPFDSSPNIPLAKRAACFDHLGAILGIGAVVITTVYEEEKRRRESKYSIKNLRILQPREVVRREPRNLMG
ncbi:MAG: hypothetical protein M1835_007909 [Candelina submexicana]|nr:MAG: hypothetical protein M1835_007909 [Candelina submexicana]